MRTGTIHHHIRPGDQLTANSMTHDGDQISVGISDGNGERFAIFGTPEQVATVGRLIVEETAQRVTGAGFTEAVLTPERVAEFIDTHNDTAVQEACAAIVTLLGHAGSQVWQMGRILHQRQEERAAATLTPLAETTEVTA